MKSAYNLNFNADIVRDDIDYIDKIWNDLSQEYKDKMNCKVFDENVYYVSKKVVKDLQLSGIQNMFDLFEDAFLDHFKIMQMMPGELYGYHIDNNKHNIHSKIPRHMICPAAVNILLSEPVGDITYFGLDKKLNKYKSWDEKNLPRNNTEEFEIIDKFETKKDAVLLNIGNWHRIESSHNQPRKLASFLLWPYNTWENYVRYCKWKGLINE